MRRLVYTMTMFTLVVIFSYSLMKVYEIYSEYKKGNDTYKEIADIAKKEDTTKTNINTQTEEKDEIDIDVDFEKLKKVNKDVVGWIYGPGTIINYPVVQGKDNEYYLKHLVNGKWNGSGTPFLDCNMAPDFSDKNMFVYGHHMKNGSMFSSITKYKDIEYYNKNKYIYLLTPKERYRLEVFSAYITNATSDTYMRGFGEDEKFKKYIEYIQGKSLINTGVTLTLKDQILSLSTCTYEYENARFVVHTKMTKLK